MSTTTSNGLEDILALPEDLRVDTLVQHASALAEALAGGQTPGEDEVNATTNALVQMVQDGSGSARQRLLLGQVLGHLGDPRLRLPTDDAYWADISYEDGNSFMVGRFLVTTWEFRAWVEAGGYTDDAAWSEAGRRSRDSSPTSWLELASAPDVDHLVVANQPVVGVSWWEAEAYAKAHDARLLTSAERRWVVRGKEKRPYPWGAPFGEGKANTREEALRRPCAVGLYRADCTPDGLFDLAGNAAEWVSDGGHEQRMLHPGSWARPSMASWAKALDMADPTARSADLGFRLARV